MIDRGNFRFAVFREGRDPELSRALAPSSGNPLLAYGRLDPALWTVAQRDGMLSMVSPPRARPQFPGQQTGHTKECERT